MRGRPSDHRAVFEAKRAAAINSLKWRDLSSPIGCQSPGGLFFALSRPLPLSYGDYTRKRALRPRKDEGSGLYQGKRSGIANASFRENGAARGFNESGFGGPFFPRLFQRRRKRICRVARRLAREAMTPATAAPFSETSTETATPATSEAASSQSMIYPEAPGSAFPGELARSETNMRRSISQGASITKSAPPITASAWARVRHRGQGGLRSLRPAVLHLRQGKIHP